MSNIPKVRKGIEQSIRKTLENMGAAKGKGKEEGVIYIESFWAKFKKDQPYLSKLVLREMMSFKSDKVAAAFAHGVWVTYAALQSQEEADDMNENWGLR